MVENIFSMRKIDSECQRHELLLSSLDLRHLQRVEHVLLDLDPVFPYSYLKAALIKIFDQTEEHKLDQLLHACELRDTLHNSPTQCRKQVPLSNNVLTESQLLGTMAVTRKKALQQYFIPSVRASCGR